jgi:phosphatidate cytidylyltransferase
MLKHRVITALSLLAALAIVVLVLPPIATLLVLTGVISLGIWEWSQFLGAGSVLWRLLYVVGVLVLMFAAWLFSYQPDSLQLLLQITLAWWGVAFVWVMRFPTPLPRLAAIITGVMVLVPPWLSLSRLLVEEGGLIWVGFILILIWATDVGAFCAGKMWGRIKLIPKVSPGKTWEGVFGGMLLALVVAFAGAELLQQPRLPFVFLCLAVAAVSIVGDLTVSMFKRHWNLKDSGRLLPGHGGVLDRIDSICSAVPVFVLGIGWQGVI